MLVLTRKSRQSIVIAGSDDLIRLLTMTVLQVRGGVVRLGFDGPARIGVHRLEVWERLLAGVSRKIVQSNGHAVGHDVGCDHAIE